MVEVLLAEPQHFLQPRGRHAVAHHYYAPLCIADLEQVPACERLAQHILTEVHLDAARPIEHMPEAGLALPPLGHETAGDAHALTRLLRDRVPLGEELGRVVRDVVAVGVRLATERAPFLDPGPSLGHQVVQGHGPSVGSPPRPSRWNGTTLGSASERVKRSDRAAITPNRPPCGRSVRSRACPPKGPPRPGTDR